MDGGINIPNEPDVVITPAPKRLGKPCATIAGRMTEPMATTVAGDEPDTAANSAQARTPASAKPPYQCPTMAVAKLIMRRATPPCVRKPPARMKNGIAMISKLSRPVNSLSATDSVRTSVSVNMKVSTVRPSEIDTGMPVSIKREQQDKHDDRAHALRQHNETGGVRDTDRQDQKRRQDQNDAERAALAIALLARGNVGGMQGIGLDTVDMGCVVVR